MSTSNSFEILHVEDDLSHLGKSATQIEFLSAVEVLDGSEHHDACNSRAEPGSPGSSHYNASDEVIVTNKDSSASQPSQICQDESGCNVAVHNDLEMPSSCVNADISLTISADIPICNEDMAINSASIGTLSACPGSNEPEGDPPGRSTRSRKAKRPAERISASGKSVPIPSKAREVQGQTKKINDILKNSKGPKSSIPLSALSNS
ncbi:hypothetical protein Nepgr_004046 [Nepenthes gracilis]|uniref:Uncharacterized protein n=1 Tax=Nepenthes gracilis TaxID=150966 RepID=A0AAD3S0N6_NEPGR|nr:hypothetical protein Nepgr_004046 [Nepenthes gracilis]